MMQGFSYLGCFFFLRGEQGTPEFWDLPKLFARGRPAQPHIKKFREPKEKVVMKSNPKICEKIYMISCQSNRVRKRTLLGKSLLDKLGEPEGSPLSENY